MTRRIGQTTRMRGSTPRAGAWCVAALILGGCAALPGPGPEEPSTAFAPSSTTPSPLGSREPTAALPEAERLSGTTVSAPGAPAALIVADGSIWEMSHRDTELYRIDPLTGDVLATIDIGLIGCGDLMANASAVYVTGCGVAPYLVRVDTATNKVTATSSYEVGPGGMAKGVLWAPVGTSSPKLVPVNPTTLAQRPGVALPEFTMITGVVQAGDSLWAGDEANNIVYRIEIDRRKVIAAIPMPVEGDYGYLIKHDGAPWYIDFGRTGTLVRIDPEDATTQVLTTTLDKPSEYWGIAASSSPSVPGHLWARSGDNHVWLINTRADRIERTIELTPGGSGGDVQEHDGTLWVSAFDEEIIHRIPLPGIPK